MATSSNQEDYNILLFWVNMGMDRITELMRKMTRSADKGEWEEYMKLKEELNDYLLSLGADMIEREYASGEIDLEEYRERMEELERDEG